MRAAGLAVSRLGRPLRRPGWTGHGTIPAGQAIRGRRPRVPVSQGGEGAATASADPSYRLVRPAAWRDRSASQADSASSILVTRSTTNAQAWMWRSMAPVMACSAPRAPCWQIMAARSLSWPIRAIRSRSPAPLAAANWLPVVARSKLALRPSLSRSAGAGPRTPPPARTESAPIEEDGAGLGSSYLARIAGAVSTAGRKISISSARVLHRSCTPASCGAL
jgi:hypothetical protein